MSLCRKFYSGANIETAYRRLLKLEAAGFIKCPVDPTGKIYLWTLDKLGFEVIRDDLPVLKEEGYRSENLIHDYWVTAIHLGEYLLSKPENVILFSEQVLRRTHMDAMPDWISSGHRPDGYWCIQEGDKIKRIALEVELNAKRNADYELIDGFYRAENVEDVLWVYPKENIGRRIQNQIMKNGSGDFGPHSFVGLQDIKINGWNSKITLGKNKGKTIYQLLHNNLTTRSEPVVMSDLLNTLKSPHRSKTYKQSEIPEKQ